MLVKVRKMYRQHQCNYQTHPYRHTGQTARAPLQSHHIVDQHVHQHRQHLRGGHRDYSYRQSVSHVRAEGDPLHHHLPHGSRQQQQCYICSYSQREPCQQAPVYHRQISSMRLRELTGVEISGSMYLCPSCKSHHRPYPEPRIKLIVSDSSSLPLTTPPPPGCTRVTSCMSTT